MLSPAAHNSQSYRVKTPVFEGPLDLLLQLIEKAQLDITKLSLAQVTDQFLEYFYQMRENTAADVSAFLVIASKLIQIKSEALLPRPPVRESGEADIGEALARQLLLYKKFKQVSEILHSRQGRMQTHPRFAPLPPLERTIDFSDYTIRDLWLLAQEIMEHEKQIPTLSTVVTAPRFTIREKIQKIADLLRESRKGVFSNLISQQAPKLEIVVTFLALLELVKRHVILARQEDLFGDIFFESVEDWYEDQGFELEFGE